MLPGTALRSVSFNKTRKDFTRNIHGARMFPQCFPVSHTGNIVSRVSFCFQDANYAYTYATRQGIFKKIRLCKHLQNLFEHEQVSTHLFFASNSSKGQILRALSNCMGPFDAPRNIYSLILARVCAVAMATGLLKTRLKK